MKRLFACLIMLTLVFAIPTHASQRNQAGANPAVSLRFSPSAKAAAMGDAFTAAAEGGIEAQYYNPAGLAWPGKREISAMYQNLVLDVGQGNLGYTHPLNDHSSIGIMTQYVDYGSTQRTIVSGNAGAASGTFSGQDIAASISYGSKMSESFGYGVTAKVFSAEIDNATATAVAADFGLRWAPNERLAVGVALKNIGTDLTFDHVAERLPVVFRGGVAFKPIAGLTLSADIEKVSQEGWSGFGGAEYLFMDMLAVRAGWNGNTQVENGFVFGGGVNLSDFNVDYAFTPFGDFGNTHRIGLKYGF